MMIMLADLTSSTTKLIRLTTVTTRLMRRRPCNDNDNVHDDNVHDGNVRDDVFFTCAFLILSWPKQQRRTVMMPENMFQAPVHTLEPN